MSFITKRERVFNEYNLFDLPARNEGKLKAYASCTDARAWSHFCSDKTEHLVEIIKRNNECCRPKYVPTEAIVNTLLANKQSEISRLKRKIEEFEQMLAVYDDLDLTCEQKCEIAKAHMAIKEANKDLNELWFDLDLSGFTGIDSEDFETGKSRGDEPSKYKEEIDEETPRSKGDEWSFEKEHPSKETKSNQVGGMNCYCDASTNAVDPRIEEMQESLIYKDAKLNAMKNSMAVMENDVCEPYCLYAHIYTALEKIFGILCQNDKYKLYLDLMTSGKNTRCLDIKGKILFKLKVLEKFNVALIAPCSQDFALHNDHNSHHSEEECSCYRAEIEPRVQMTYALTSAESQHPSTDNQRAHLVADIMENEEMRDILRKENNPVKTKVDTDDIVIETYDINHENLNRIKNLQENYDELMTCYEALQVEKDCLLIRCQKYEDLEKELETVKNQLREYNALWNEKEHYRKRSLDLDSLKGQYMVLRDETTNLETELKAESEINNIKTKTIEELRSENMVLEKKLTDATIAFEKEKNCARCKLNESECTIMCQGQQIKSLSLQIDKLLEQDDGVPQQQPETSAIVLIDEINSLKEQLQNLRGALFSTDEEKQKLEEEYQNKLNLINDFRMELEDYKSNYEKTLQRNAYLEEYTESFRDEVNTLVNENKQLSQTVENNTNAIDNLMNVINNKSREISALMEDIEHKKKENKKLNDVVELAKRESNELSEKLKNFKDIVQEKDNLSQAYQEQNEHINQLKALLIKTQQQNKQIDLDRHVDNSILMEENERLKMSLHNEQLSLELTKKDSKILKDKLQSYEKFSDQMQEKTENIRILEEKLKHIEDAYKKNITEQQRLQSELNVKKNDFDELQKSFNNLEDINNEKSQQLEALSKELDFLKQTYSIILGEKEVLQKHLDIKTDEINILYDNLETKIQENKSLLQQFESLECNHKTIQNDMGTLQKEYLSTKNSLSSLKKESDELIDKVKFHEVLQLQFDKLQKEHDQVKEAKAKLQKDLDRHIAEFKKVDEENKALNAESQNLLLHSEDLEKALINARAQLIVSTSRPDNPHMDIINEIEELKKEKISKHKDIRNLLDKLEESESLISNLSEDILARDDKIAILENHINELQDEVKRLHNSLGEIIDTGEQIKESSYQKIRESLSTMEAHHSKATHNMKMELAKLQTENTTLQEKLSIDKIKSDDSTRDKYKYISQIAHLQNEREIIVTDIKQLELNSVGDSELSPENCDIEEIIRSLDRVRRHIDLINSKSVSLEQTLLKVQNSYQVVQSKADEAKKIVENEKQKILNEKEEAIRDRLQMEKQLSDLKEQLKTQISDDKCVIKDLEAEIQNQTLIFDKLNQSTQSYVAKLKDEMQAIQDLYNDSLKHITELEKKLNVSTEEKNSLLQIIDEVNTSLRDKNEQINVLHKDINDLKNKTNYSQAVQVFVLSENDKGTQTYEEIMQEDFDRFYNTNKNKSKPDIEFGSTYGNNRASFESTNYEKEFAKHGNEVQILTASIEPTFYYDRNSYLNHKLKQLSFGPLEYGSYPGTREYDVDQGDKDIPVLDVKEGINSTITNPTTEDMNVIDIYNKQSIHTNSSKNVNSNYTDDDRYNRIRRKNSVNIDLDLRDKSFDKKSSPYKASNLIGSVSQLSTDQDVFMIYKDSEINDANFANENKHFFTSGHVGEPVKATSVNSNHNAKQLNKDTNLRNERPHENGLYLYPENKESTEDDSVKYKMKISIPRVKTDTSTADNIINEDKKSVDSFTLNTYSISKSTNSSKSRIEDNSKTWKANHKKYLDHLISNDVSRSLQPRLVNKYDKNRYTSSLTNKNNSKHSSKLSQITRELNEDKNPSSDLDQTQSDDQSQHTLSRIDADLHLFQTEGAVVAANADKYENDKTNNYGLNYILATTQMDPDNIKIYNAVRDSLRKSRSDDLYNLAKLQEVSDTSPSNNQSCLSIQKKSFTEKGTNTMVNLDAIQGDESKLNYLTENIKKHYEKKIEAIKMQYDSNIKNIFNNHNEGVKSIQSLHEETLQDIIKHHENEVENLRTLSIEAMRKADKLENECRSLKCKLQICDPVTCLNEEPVKNITPELKRQKKSRQDARTLTKTKIEAFNVRPKSQSSGPCTCSLDINVSDTIRNIFEQVDVEQRKKAEHTYIKYIANKMMHDTVEALDCHELSFLHLKVCRIWKNKLTKEETLQKRIDSLEAELMNKQWDARKNMEELDREVAEQRRRLQEKREAVCRNVPTAARFDNSEADPGYASSLFPPTPDKNIPCNCNTPTGNMSVGERRSAGDLVPVPNSTSRSKTTRTETNRTLAKSDAEERRERRKKEEEDKKMYTDELPTRLRRPPVRHNRKQ